MHICVTHVDASTGIPCFDAPMSNGPIFPMVKGLHIEFGNETQWPTYTPLFFGTCDDDADITVAGVIRSLTPDEYISERVKEDNIKSRQVRQHREYLLQTKVDSINPMRWESMTPEQRDVYRTYRQALLDVPSQQGFPWKIQWPDQP
jgi:hypothetical protein